MNNEIDRIGKMENGFAASYDFMISDVIKEGWAKVYGFKAPIWGALGLYVFVIIVMAILAGLLGAIVNSDEVAKFFNGVFHFAVYPMIAGMLMMGIRHSVNLPVDAFLVFRYFKYFWRIIGTVLLMMILTSLPLIVAGLICFAIMLIHGIAIQCLLALVAFGISLISIYLAWGYLFAIQLVIEKKLSIWQAMEVSRKGVTQHWWKLFFTSWVMIGMYLLSIIPLILSFISPITIILAIPSVIWMVVSLVWLVPFIFTTRGVLYRIIFGVEPDLAQNN